MITSHLNSVLLSYSLFFGIQFLPALIHRVASISRELEECM